MRCADDGGGKVVLLRVVIKSSKDGSMGCCYTLTKENEQSKDSCSTVSLPCSFLQWV